MCPRLAGLAAHGLQLTDINYVVLTHRAVDSMGNLNLFYATRILVGNQQIIRDTVFEQTRPPQFVSGV
jgi:glyoxylase-like metal-dependent hydrolase (beta-lactamase superfamily II)